MDILNFYKSVYISEDRSIIVCHYINKNEDKFIEIINIKEYSSDSKSRHDIIDVRPTFQKITLPKSQIEILVEDEEHENFFYIKIPYWLYKKNIYELEMVRIQPNEKDNFFAIASSNKTVEYQNNFKDEVNYKVLRTLGYSEECINRVTRLRI